jgi:cysteinyl-tRNA synthetase
MIRIFDSMTGEKQPLDPIRAGEVSIYVCGDTVYDYAHIGHARSKVAFDVVRRHLTWSGLRVRFVRNITDIDDKIIRRAAELGESIGTFTERFIRAMHEDYDRLGILRPDLEPRATEHVAGMIAMTSRLLEKNHAYVGESGDVLYAVASFPPYGRLARKRLEDLRAGARVDVDASKRDPLDFVLWKRAKPGEPSWDSPWGAGRPGWHIECSVMSADLLGTHFDIHGGGMDLKFPHHENEIAQSCAATGDRFANLWMHNGFVTVDDEKMSKSIGNFFTIREVLDSGFVRHAEVLRYFLMASHYRGPLNYSLEQIDQADAALTRLYTVLRDTGSPKPRPSAAGSATERFRAALDDDFNTPEALAVLQMLATEANRARDAGEADRAGELVDELRELAGVLALLREPPADWFRLARRAPPSSADAASASGASAVAGSLDAATIDALIAERAAARQARQFKRSDEIRDQLAAAGVLLEDRPGQSTIWRYR